MESIAAAPRLGRSPRARGKPGPGCRPSTRNRVDPRGRGETLGEPVRATRDQGRSPRARGNRIHWSSRKRRKAGRSPRARGNLGIQVTFRALMGSIPAGAGKPATASSVTDASKVDPRGRGETSIRPAASKRARGRSPRARGNLRREWSSSPRGGSIPAGGAGKPHALSSIRIAWEMGSIPAGAGKPRTAASWTSSIRVDPRGRGETCEPTKSTPSLQGRSPRARGNQA